MVGCKILILGTIVSVAITLYGCGSDSNSNAVECKDDEPLYKTTDQKHERKFSIGGSLIVSNDHPEFNISEPAFYADLDIVYFDALFWVEGQFLDPETGVPIDQLMQDRGCDSANFKRQHQIRTIIHNTNLIKSYFMWSFSPTFGEADNVTVTQAAEQLASVVGLYGDGVNLKWDQGQSSETFKRFLCELHHAFAKKKLESSKISVSGPFPSLYNRNSTRPKKALKSDGILGGILKSQCVSTAKVSASPQEVPSSPVVLDVVDWVEAEVFNLNARQVFNNHNNKTGRTPSGLGDRFYFSISELNATVDWLGTAFNKSKLRLSFKTGQQLGPHGSPQGVWEGPKADLEMMWRLKKSKFGGFTFWGMNAYTAGGSSPPLQSPCCLDPDVTGDYKYKDCGDGQNRYEHNVNKHDGIICTVKTKYPHDACAWWQGDTPSNAAWLIHEFNHPDPDDCPFNHSRYCRSDVLRRSHNMLTV